MPKINEQMQKLYGSGSPSANFLDQMHTLMLVNSHPAIDFAESLPPNIIQVGGLQIKEPKALPSDINEFVLKGKKGTVLMGLGTNLRSDQLGEENIIKIIEAFRQIPEYNFIWKFETSDMIKDLPNNLMIRDWLPQNDILAHSNVKGFITHGGLLSTHESIWHGVPMVVIPLYSDQHRNSFRIVNAGMGLKINLHSFTTDKLRKSIVEVLHSPKIRKNVQQQSKRFRDQPEKPLDRAVWWSEYVMRNPKPLHLRQGTFNFGLLGSHFWDIQVIIILAILIAFWGIKKLLKIVFSSESKTIIVRNDNKKKN